MHKNSAMKAEILRKNHISHLTRRNPLKYRIVAFAQEVAAKKIQRYFREYIGMKFSDFSFYFTFQEFHKIIIYANFNRAEKRARDYQI